MLATTLVQVPEAAGAKGRITLLRCNGERAKHSRLEKLECSEGSQGKKSIVSQRGGLVYLLPREEMMMMKKTRLMQDFNTITINDRRPEYPCLVLLTETFYRVCHFL